MTFNILPETTMTTPKTLPFYSKNKKWELAPAYDPAYSHKPGSHG